MLLCAIIDELNSQLADRDLLSYFSYQASDARINSALAVLRGLMLLLVDQQPSLISHILEECDHSGKNLVCTLPTFCKAAAVKYRIPALQKLAASTFSRVAQINCNDRSFAEATRIAYTTTSEDIRDLRDTVVKSIKEHCSLLDKVSIETAVKDIAALNFELLRMAHGMPAVAETKIEDESFKFTIEYLSGFGIAEGLY
ncbi:hypothetical protein LTR56_027823 [Elasticomyces elasticus]|nr:hypothetical protein LTR56_027823 [Elasticomyces elasticus]KAK3615481.1 hypothetical protein LTR22_027421 [Elasticomyces elasticus]